MNTTLQCPNCQGTMELSEAQLRDRVYCPHCATPIEFNHPAPAPPPVPITPMAPATPIPKPAKPKNRRGTVGLNMVSIFGWLLGLALIVNGCEADSRDNGSAVRQTVYTVQYCSGFIIILLSACLWALARVVDGD